MGQKVREMDKCMDQVTDQEEKRKKQEEDLRVAEKIKKKLNRMGKNTLIQN